MIQSIPHFYFYGTSSPKIGCAKMVWAIVFNCSMNLLQNVLAYTDCRSSAGASTEGVRRPPLDSLLKRLVG